VDRPELRVAIPGTESRGTALTAAPIRFRRTPGPWH
jgi:hypothetical protein